MDLPANTPAPDDSDPADDTKGIPLDGPEPALDPHVDAQVRRLLATMPDPGPMPETYVRRISAALAEEARRRVGPGSPSTDRPGSPSTDRPGSDQGSAEVAAADVRAVAPLIRQPRRRRPLFAAAAVAAAAALVVVGGSLLHLNKQAPDAAAVVGAYSATATTTTTTAATTTATTPGAGSSASSGTGIHLQVSTTAYDATNLATRARYLLSSPGPALPDPGTDAPGLGPIATPLGLRSCLNAISAPARAVSVDLATWDGRPAAIIVARADSGVVAYVVERSCSTGNPGLLKDATPIP